MNLTLKDIEDVQRQIDELKAKVEEDTFKDLKKAHSEGAIIEYANSVNEYRWEPSNDNRPDWTAPKYRIKGNISISSWNAHKDLIKQYWDGANIEYKQNFTTVWVGGEPAWSINSEYRIKPKEPIYEWQLPEYEDGSIYIANGEALVYDSMTQSYTSSGRRRATKALAERCAKASKERDLLEAYRDYLEPDYVDPNWNNANENKYYIGLHRDKYYVDYNFNTKSLGTVYMGEQTAKKICKALNNGNISL